MHNAWSSTQPVPSPPWIGLVCVAACFFLGIGLVMMPSYIVILMVFAVGAELAFLTGPKAALAALLLVRPSLEAFGDLYLPTPLGDVLNPAGIVTLALISGTLLWVINRRIKVASYALSRPYLLFLVVSGVSVAVSPAPAAAMGEWLRFLSYFIVYILVRATVQTPQDVSRLGRAVILSSLIPVAVGLYQIATNQGMVFYGISQIRSVFMHMNIYGIYLVIVGMTTLQAYASASTWGMRGTYAMFLILILVSMLATYARVAWVGFIVGVVVIGALEYRTWLLLLPPALGAVWMGIPNVRTRIMLAFAGNDAQTNSLVTRWVRWQEAFRLFQSHPVLGIGLRSYNLMSAALTGQQSAYGGVEVHSSYIQILAETGALGISTFLWLQLALVKEAWKAIRIVRDPRLRPAALTFAGILSATLVMGLTDNLLSSPVIQWYLWTFAGLAGCTIELQTQNGSYLGGTDTCA